MTSRRLEAIVAEMTQVLDATRSVTHDPYVSKEDLKNWRAIVKTVSTAIQSVASKEETARGSRMIREGQGVVSITRSRDNSLVWVAIYDHIRDRWREAPLNRRNARRIRDELSVWLDGEHRARKKGAIEASVENAREGARELDKKAKRTFSR